MDLPWNPAVLEQRIARIHRMGQKRPVQIVNFVAKGTIEEGMLSVLAFKRSLSAGILDGGANEISLGGSRLTRFMKEIENVTGSMGESEAVTAAEEAGGAVAAGSARAGDGGRDAEAVVGEASGQSVAASASAPQDRDGDPWQALMSAGMQFASAMAAAGDPAGPAHPWIERDPSTGAHNLKMPLPRPETVRALADAFQAIAQSLRRAAM
jgi:hypothetical protein